MSAPSSELVSYVSAALAAGKTPDAVRAELVVAGWAAADIDAALVSTAPVMPPAKIAAEPVSLVPWKLIIVAGCILVVVLLAVAAFLFFGKRAAPSAAPGNANAPSANVPAANAPVASSKIYDSSGGKAKDDAAINDLDLVVYSSNVLDQANAYLDAATLRGVTTGSSVYPDADILKLLSGDEPWNQAFADEVINNNGAFITNFSAAVGRPGFQVPEFGNPRSYESATPEVDYAPLVRLTEVLALEALSSDKKGDLPDAAAEALAISVYGQKMADSQINETGYLIGLNIKKLGLNTLKNILSSAKIAPELAGQLDGTLVSFDDASSSLAMSYKIGYWIYRNKLAAAIKDPAKYYPDLAPEKFNDLYFFEPNKTVNLLGDNVRAAIAMAGQTCREFSDQTISGADQAALQKMDSENGFGKLYASALQTGYAASLNARCADAALTASVRAALAPLATGK